MVDPVSGAGGPQNLAPTNRAQGNKQTDDKRTGEASSSPADEVQISQEALALQSEQQAEDIAKATRSLLQEQLDETLSVDRQRVDTLL